ncbi:MAG: hypothetical protein ACLR23_03695 [Clostridia bacterium]
MMVASIFGLGGMKLGSARQKVVTAFFTGRDGFSPYDDLINRREYAYNLLHIAEDASSRTRPPIQPHTQPGSSSIPPKLRKTIMRQI